jgi:ATP-dependent DNA helicase RecG
MCVAAGIAPPDFQELTGGAVVTFRVPVAGYGAESRGQSGGQSGGQSNKILNTLRPAPLSVSEIAAGLGLKARTGALRRALGALVREGMVELTVPDKPNSRLQRYRLTSAGRASLAKIGSR